jgi:hypothetical protein
MEKVTERSALVDGLEFMQWVRDDGVPVAVFDPKTYVLMTRQGDASPPEFKLERMGGDGEYEARGKVRALGYQIRGLS